MILYQFSVVVFVCILIIIYLYFLLSDEDTFAATSIKKTKKQTVPVPFGVFLCVVFPPRSENEIHT